MEEEEFSRDSGFSVSVFIIGTLLFVKLIVALLFQPLFIFSPLCYIVVVVTSKVCAHQSFLFVLFYVGPRLLRQYLGL